MANGKSQPTRKTAVREAAVKGEKIIAEYLDKHLYVKDNHLYIQRFPDDTLMQKICRTDLYLLSGSTNEDENYTGYLVDEKASLNYIHNELKTFACEIAEYHGRIRIAGWLTAKLAKADSYIFILPTAKENTDEIKSTDDIDYCECIMITKDSIKKHLEAYGWDDAKLLRKADNIALRGDKAFGSLKENGMKFSVTDDGDNNKTVNILLPLEWYRINAVDRWRI